jgi:hypothetical protein
MRIPQRTTLLVLLITASAIAHAAEPNVVIQWNQALLQGVRDSALGPPMVARALSQSHIRALMTLGQLMTSTRWEHSWVPKCEDREESDRSRIRTRRSVLPHAIRSN